MTVHGLDGVDEISLSGTTVIVTRKNGHTIREEIIPEDLGLHKCSSEMVAGGDPEQNARITASILSGKLGRADPRVQIVAANAAAGLLLCEAVNDMKTGVEVALNTMEQGNALKVLRPLIELSGGDPKRLESMV
jgi:anthranilate phosphoribosyltransferase